MIEIFAVVICLAVGSNYCKIADTLPTFRSADACKHFIETNFSSRQVNGGQIFCAKKTVATWDRVE